jgi:hypothetical protein
MAMSVEGKFNVQPQLLDQLYVTIGRLQHGIDQDPFFCRFVRKQVGVSGRLLLEKLPEDETVHVQNWFGRKRTPDWFYTTGAVIMICDFWSRSSVRVTRT